MTREIYTSLPVKPSTNAEIKSKILTLLRNQPEQWITAVEIASQVGLKENDKTKPTIRAAAKELLGEGHPIATSKKGFVYTDNNKLMELFRDSMQNRVHAMTRTIRDIDRLLSVNSPEQNSMEKYYVEKEGAPCDSSPTGFHVGVPSEHGLVCLWCKKKLKKASKEAQNGD